MSEFFNRKEEVLDIQITPLGRDLLALGKWKPVYYEFFDDDILYDSRHGGTTEQQNATEDRIKEASRIKIKRKFEGKGLRAGLGTSEPGNEHVPAWSVRLYDGKLTEVTKNITGSFFAFSEIPQLEAVVKYETYVGDLASPGIVTEPLTDSGIGGDDADGGFRVNDYIFDDDTFIEVDKDEIFAKIQEKNGLFQKENFDIEVFEIELVTDPKTNMLVEQTTRLEFADEKNLELEGAEVTDEFVEYYFNLNADQEIEDRDFCRKVPKEERELLFMEKSFDCEDIDEDKRVRVNIYDSESGDIC